MSRIQGLFEVFAEADTLLKAAAGEIHALTVAWKNATVGDFVLLRDGLDITGSTKIAIVFSTVNGTIHFTWPQGKRFDIGIFLDIGPLGVGEAVFFSCTAK